jgi:hypothetical protein
MPDAAREDVAVARARLQGKRVALVIVIGVTVALIGSSAVQIIPAVFGAPVSSIPPAPPGSSARTCAVGVKSLAAAVDRAGTAALSSSPGPGGEADAAARFRQALSPEWDGQEAVAQACAGSGEGLDAWAALLRLRSAEEQLTLRSQAELGPLRRDVTAHLPADLR